MAFILKDLEKKTLDQEVEAYKESIKKIIIKLPDHLKPDDVDWKDEKYNFFNYPRLWSQSSRAGATPITTVNPASTASAYEDIVQHLKTRLKTYPYFTNVPKLIEDKKELDLALQVLENVQRDSIKKYRDLLQRESLAELLKLIGEDQESLAQYKNQDILHLRTSITNRLKNFTPESLNEAIYTKAEALNWFQKMDRLRKDITKLSASVTNEEKKAQITHMNEQVSILTKRLLDSYYDHPRKYTFAEKIRQITKGGSSAIGGGLAIAAFACLFIPGAQPLAAIFGLVSLVALYPLLDTAGEVLRNLKNNRSPTKAQITELGITVPLLAGIAGGAHLFTAIGTLIANKSAVIGAKFNATGAFIGTKFNDAFGGFFNTVNAVIMTKEAGEVIAKRENHQTLNQGPTDVKDKTDKQINNVAGGSESHIFHSFTVKVKTSSTHDREETFDHAGSSHLHNAVYSKPSSGNGSENIKQDNHDHLFSHNDIAEALEKYLHLQDNVPIHERLGHLQHLINAIKQHGVHNQMTKTLLDKTIAEQKSLKDIQEKMRRHDIKEFSIEKKSHHTEKH